MLACVGVYFYGVLALFQTMNNTFVIEDLEDYQDPTSADNGKFTTAFLVTSGVSLSIITNHFYSLM